MKKSGLTPLKIRGKPLKSYCWAKPAKKGKLEGTYEECYRKGQIRLWGKKSK